MTTNIDRATHVINETYADEYVKPHMTPPKVAQALADAGLLMPDLPETSETDGLIYFGDDGKTYALPDGRVAVLHGDWWSYATAEELRNHAYALLAAADHTERNYHEPE